MAFQMHKMYALLLLSIMVLSCEPIHIGIEDQDNKEPVENPGNQDNPDTPGDSGNQDNPDKPDNPSSPAENGSGETGGYKLVWEDLFNGSVLDESVWNIEVNGDGGGNNELQYYRAENVSLGKEPGSGRGCLILTAKKEGFGGKSFTSGRINSRNKKSFKYGKIESSIKLPTTANGLWPAFWMMGNNYDSVGWPKCGEIDILEMGNAQGISSGTQDRFFNGACHWGYYKEVSPGNWAYPNYAKSSTWSYSLQDGEFHLFTLIWDNAAVKMYVDLDKYPSSSPYYEMGITSREDDWGTGYYFNHDFFILFNLAVGGHFTGILDPGAISALASGEARMYVDYVKVYQKL